MRFRIRLPQFLDLGLQFCQTLDLPLNVSKGGSEFQNLSLQTLVFFGNYRHFLRFRLEEFGLEVVDAAVV